MITRHVKVLVECEVRADIDPKTISHFVEQIIQHDGMFSEVEAVLVSASGIDDPFFEFAPRTRAKEKRRRIARFFLRVALRRLGLS